MSPFPTDEGSPEFSPSPNPSPELSPGPINFYFEFECKPEPGNEPEPGAEPGIELGIEPEPGVEPGIECEPEPGLYLLSVGPPEGLGPAVIYGISSCKGGLRHQRGLKSTCKCRLKVNPGTLKPTGCVHKAEKQQMPTASEDISKSAKSPSLNSTEDENEQRRNGRAVMRNDFKSLFLAFC